MIFLQSSSVFARRIASTSVPLRLGRFIQSTYSSCTSSSPIAAHIGSFSSRLLLFGLRMSFCCSKFRADGTNCFERYVARRSSSSGDEELWKVGSVTASTHQSCRRSESEEFPNLDGHWTVKKPAAAACRAGESFAEHSAHLRVMQQANERVMLPLWPQDNAEKFTVMAELQKNGCQEVRLQRDSCKGDPPLTSQPERPFKLHVACLSHLQEVHCNLLASERHKTWLSYCRQKSLRNSLQRLNSGGNCPVSLREKCIKRWL